MSGFREQGQMRMVERCLIEVAVVWSWVLRKWVKEGSVGGREEARVRSCRDCIAMLAQSEEPCGCVFCVL